MDTWHKLGRIVCFSNLGTLLFFALNIYTILKLFYPQGITLQDSLPLIGCYIISLVLSISPLGEWILTSLAGAKEINRKDIQLRLIPLLEIVFTQAKERTPYMIESIHLKIIEDQSSAAFAIGKKTICVTYGLLNLSDEEIMAVFAHEVGHLAYQHSVIQLFIGGGNLCISVFFLIIKSCCLFVTAIFLIIGVSTRSFWGGFFLTLLGIFPTFLIWIWTKFCMLFLTWSMRQNEFIADEYAYRLGYGTILARILDRHMCSAPSGGLLNALYSTHPHSNDRIAHLQELGANYSRYS